MTACHANLAQEDCFPGIRRNGPGPLRNASLQEDKGAKLDRAREGVSAGNMGTATVNGHRQQRLLSPYENVVRGLSDRLVEAQRPIRILDAIKWDDEVERAFIARGSRTLPPVSRNYYLSRPLPFDPQQKLEEFLALERDLHRELGQDDAPGQIMARMCREYRDVVHMLAARGTRAFSEASQRLYGSAADRFHGGDLKLADLGKAMGDVLATLSNDPCLTRVEATVGAPEAVQLLAERLTAYFRDPLAVRVKLSDGIVADAAAGSDYIKIRGNVCFTPRQVRLLEVHEGWVHLGTTLNGQSQPVCTFLGKGPPSATVTQEGLAVLTEILAFASHPGRVRRLTNRIEGVAMAENGANFLEVYQFFLEEGFEPREAYQHAMRIFRGSLPEGCGPFTKDLCYSKGFVLVYNFVRLAVQRGMVRHVPLLFCGKTTLTDVKALAQLVDDGLVAPPRFVPPQFSDLHGLAVWMCYASFLGRLSVRHIEDDYASLF